MKSRCYNSIWNKMLIISRLQLIIGNDLDKDSIFIYSYFVPCTNLLCMHYFIYFFQRSEHAVGGGDKESSFHSNVMALRCKLKRNHQKHITEVIVVITPELVSFIRKQRILSEEMLCLRRHGHVKHTLRVPLTCKLWLLPEPSEVLVAGVQQSSIGVTLEVGEIDPQEEIGCSDDWSQKEESTWTSVGAPLPLSLWRAMCSN